MPTPKIAVLIRENPKLTHRAAEGIRIALGLSTGPNPLSVILTDEARILLTDEAFDTEAGEVLEKHLPVLRDLQIPIFVPESTRSQFHIDPEFVIQEIPETHIPSLLAQSDRVLVF